jgi:formate--tetrahydrofolate ligase
MAKTQYSFSTDPTLKGAPENFTVTIREARLSAGAGFIVALCGDVLTMPGLPRHPAAEDIFVTPDGQIGGLS